MWFSLCVYQAMGWGRNFNLPIHLVTVSSGKCRYFLVLNSPFQVNTDSSTLLLPPIMSFSRCHLAIWKSLHFTFKEVAQRALHSLENPSAALCLSCSLQWWWSLSSWLYLTLGQWYHTWPKCNLVKVMANTNIRLRKNRPQERKVSVLGPTP